MNALGGQPPAAIFKFLIRCFETFLEPLNVDSDSNRQSQVLSMASKYFLGRKVACGQPFVTCGGGVISIRVWRR